MALNNFAAQVALAFGLGAAVSGGGVYMYNDVQNTQELLGDTKKFRYSPTSKIKGFYWHHIAGDMTPEQVDEFHDNKFRAGGIGYTLYFDDGVTEYVSPWDVRKIQAANQNTISKGFVFNGNFEKEYPKHEDLDQASIMLYCALKCFPHVEWVRPHNENPHSATKCPGKNLEKALRRRGLIFDSREEMQPWLEMMDRRLLNPCLDDSYYVDGEPC